MVLHISINFSGTLPSLGIIIAQLHINTGLVMEYDQTRMDLICAELNSSLGIYQGEANNYEITVFGLPDFKSSYLIDATIYTLVQLGGEFDSPLPEWAGLKWEIAKLIM